MAHFSYEYTTNRDFAFLLEIWQDIWNFDCFSAEKTWWWFVIFEIWVFYSIQDVQKVATYFLYKISEEKCFEQVFNPFRSRIESLEHYFIWSIKVRNRAIGYFFTTTHCTCLVSFENEAHTLMGIELLSGDLFSLLKPLRKDSMWGDVFQRHIEFYWYSYIEVYGFSFRQLL